PRLDPASSNDKSSPSHSRASATTPSVCPQCRCAPTPRHWRPRSSPPPFAKSPCNPPACMPPAPVARSPAFLNLPDGIHQPPSLDPQLPTPVSYQPEAATAAVPEFHPLRRRHSIDRPPSASPRPSLWL